MLGRNRATVRDLRSLALLAVVAVGFLWRCNVAGRVMLPADLLLIMEPWRHHSHSFPEFDRVSNPILDAVQQFYPWRKFAGESLRRGEIPLWNPYVLCGNPFVGNNQSAVFYPETWLHALMPTERALGWATSLYFFVTGGLMFWYLRLIGLRRPACLLGAIAFMFNGFIIGWLCFPSFRSVPGWLPGMLVGVEYMVRDRRAKGTALCALCGGMQFLAGNLHISLYVLLMTGAYCAARCLSTWRNGARRLALTVLCCGGSAVVLGGMLASGQLLPTLELARMSSRSSGVSYATLLQHALAPQALLTGLMPDLFGNPVDYNHWGAQLGRTYRAYTESAFYVGVAPLLFAPFAFGLRRRDALLWLSLAVVGALLATGTPANAVLYHAIPLFKSLSGIGRAVLLMSTALSILGAMGLDGALRTAAHDKPGFHRNLAACALVIGVVGLVGGLWIWSATGGLERELEGIGSYTLAQVGRFGALLLASAVGAALMPWRPRGGAAVVLVCLVADLYVFVDKFTPACDTDYLHVRSHVVDTVHADRRHPRILSLGTDGIHRMAPNTPMIVGLEDIQGSDSLEIGASRELWGAGCSEERGFPQSDPSLPLVDLLGARYVHSSRPIEDVPKLSLLADDEGYLYENHQALSRAFTVPAWQVSGPRETLATVSRTTFAPTDRALLSGAAVPILPVPAGKWTPVSVTAHHPNRVELSAPFRRGQLVVLADTYYPGWRAYQGTTVLPVMRAYHALRAVQVVSDSTKLTFVFLPQSFRLGLFVGLLATACIAGLIVGVCVAGGSRR